MEARAVSRAGIRFLDAEEAVDAANWPIPVVPLAQKTFGTP